MERFARGRRSAPGVTAQSATGKRFGIGLSLVREIAAAHSGTFELTGIPGEGARATLTLPAAPSARHRRQFRLTAGTAFRR